MDDFLLGVFEGEIETQCRFMVIGAQLVNQQLQQHSPESGSLIWFALQGILVSAANVSKLLWGSKSADDLAARQRLRGVLQIHEHSAFYARKLRNDFEHFDERVETWFERSANHIYIGRLIGGSNAISVGGQDPSDKFGQFDPEHATVTFWDRTVDLNPVIAEAQRVLALIEQRRGTRP